MLEYLKKKLKHAPYFTVWNYFLVPYVPALKGVALVTLPHVALLFFVALVGSEAIIGADTLKAFWDETPQSDELWFRAWKGRIGLIYLWFALYIIQFSAGMMVPIPKSEEENLIVETMRKKYTESFAQDENHKMVNAKGKKIKWYKNGEEDSYLMSEEENPDQEEDLLDEEKQEQEMLVLEAEELLEKYPDQSPISILKMKTSAQSFLLLLVVMCFGVILNLGYREFTRTNYLLLVPLYCILDYMLVFLLKSIFMREMLLAGPVLFVFQFCTAMNNFAGADMNQFAQMWAYWIGWSFICRVFVDPVVFNLRRFKILFYNWFLEKSKNDDFYEKFLNLFSVEKNDVLYFFHMNEDLEMTDEVPIESVSLIMLNFSIRMQLNLIKPILLVIVGFIMEPCIPTSVDVYKNKGYSSEFWLYLMLMLGTIPIQMGLDALALYLIDAIHSYGMLDFMRFCKYRHANRKEDWVFGVGMVLDISVEKEFRSLDFLNFSDQYYFMVGVANWGCIIGMVGIQIMTINSYNFFEDPLWFAFLLIIILVAFVGRLFCRFIQNYFKIWEAPKPADSKAFNFAMNLENYMLKEWNIYEHDAVRHSLVETKKEWIIENLPKFITKDHFLEDNGFLIKVLKRLEDILRKEDIEVVRHNLVEKNTYVSKEQRGEKTDQNNAIVFSSKPQFIKTIVMLQYWHILGREAVNYRSMISGIKDSYLEPYCFQCKSDEELHVHEEVSLYDILMKFRVYLAGLIPRKEEWVSFYTKNQVFRTVCRNCLTLKEIKAYLEGSKRAKKSDKTSYQEFTKSIKSSAKKPKKLHYDILKSEVRGSTKAILLKWHMAARARLLHRPPPPQVETSSKTQSPTGVHKFPKLH